MSLARERNIFQRYHFQDFGLIVIVYVKRVDFQYLKSDVGGSSTRIRPLLYLIYLDERHSAYLRPFANQTVENKP